VSFNGRLFGRRLKAAMALADMSLKQVAQASGLSYEVVRTMAAGERKQKPSWPELDAVARAVNQHADWLLRLDFSLEDVTPPDATEDDSDAVAGPLTALEEAVSLLEQRVAHLEKRTEHGEP
jgi:transcriptional regulator with XRE-family HTH domain